MTALYNEIEPFAAAWLKELIKEEHIAHGIVDQRSIEDISPDDLFTHRQVHLFAGIGVWSHALRLARIPDDFSVWTASCPCQPFSTAGKGAGFADERHLWPAVAWLVAQCRPQLIFGEQVSGRDGKAWLDVVFTDLEALGYTCGAVSWGACGVGAPHIRKRLYWCAHRMADSSSGGWQQGDTYTVGDATLDREKRLHIHGSSDVCDAIGMADAGSLTEGRDRSEQKASRFFFGATAHSRDDGPWADCEWVPCSDGKTRPVKRGICPLADGIAGRVGMLRGYGNAIVAKQAEEFIRAAMNIGSSLP